VSRRRAAIPIFSCVLLLSACASLPKKALLPVPPEQVGQWKRATMDTPAEPELAPEVRNLKPTKWVRSVFTRRESTIVLTGFAMPTEASAFEAEQRHPKGSGTVVFRQGAVFATCSSQTEPTAIVLEFVKELEPVWLGAQKP
jgi:hypothetical protein